MIMRESNEIEKDILMVSNFVVTYGQQELVLQLH